MSNEDYPAQTGTVYSENVIVEYQQKVKLLEEENEKLKKERDFFEQEFHKTLQCQADDMEEYEKENKKLKEESKVDKEFQEEVMQENKKLKQKATAWDIIDSVEWKYVRDLCDKEMCEDLIECGECKEEDFQGYEGYEDPDEE